MAFESLDISSKGKNFWENTHSGIKIQGTNKEKEEYAKQRAQHLLSLLRDIPKGAFSLTERLELFSFDPNSYALNQKNIGTTNLKFLDQYLVFDTLFQRLFVCHAKFSSTEGAAILQEMQDQLGPDIEWIGVSENTWADLHKEVSEHIQAVQKEEKPSRTNIALQNDTEENATQREQEEKKGTEETKKAVRGMTFREILNMMQGIFLKLHRLDERMFEMREEQAEDRAEARRALRKAKDQVKDEIKHEVEKLRICAEEAKRKNADLSLELD